MTNEKKQAFTLRITSANSTELIEILYEMLLEYVDDAKAAIEKNDINEIHDSIRKARGCLRELMESIDFEYDLAGYFMSLYAYVNKELLLAEIRKDVKIFDIFYILSKVFCFGIFTKNRCNSLIKFLNLVLFDLFFGDDICGANQKTTCGCNGT